MKEIERKARELISDEDNDRVWLGNDPLLGQEESYQMASDLQDTVKATITDAYMSGHIITELDHEVSACVTAVPQTLPPDQKELLIETTLSRIIENQD